MFALPILVDSEDEKPTGLGDATDASTSTTELDDFKPPSIDREPYGLGDATDASTLTTELDDFKPLSIDRKPYGLGDSTDASTLTTELDDSKPPSIDRKPYGLKMEVSIPTMELLRHERRVKQEDLKKLDKMKNPKVKKAENWGLHPDTLRARFQALGPSALDLFPITLDKGSQDVMISRDFMAHKYGGSMQATCPEVSKKRKEKHGLDDFMYLHPGYQPVAPQVPGACGLFFITSTSIGMEWHTLQRVFTRIESNVWQYMGMYRLTPSPSLTRREWLDQEPKVQKTWGKEICRQNWGSNVRARVFARKRLRREPTAEEIEDLYEEGSQRHSVAPEDIMAAFSSGEEELGIWLMECVGYDNAFQLELCDKFPLWVPPPRRPKGSGKKSKLAGRKRKREDCSGSDSQNDSDDEKELKGKSSPKKTRVAGRKRKREASPDSEFEANTGLGGNFNDFSEDEDNIPTYTPRGTRSRPICL